MVATGGDSALGGDDYDHALADWVLAQTGLTVNSPADKASLKQAARRCKEALSATEFVAFEAQLTGSKLVFDVKRTDFEAATQALTARTLNAVRKALRDPSTAHSFAPIRTGWDDRNAGFELGGYRRIAGDGDAASAGRRSDRRLYHQ